MASGRHFTHPVTLVEGTGKRCLEEPEVRFFRAVGRAEDSSHFAAKEIFEGLEELLVEDVIFVGVLLLQRLHLLLDGDVESQLLALSFCVD